MTGEKGVEIANLPDHPLHEIYRSIVKRAEKVLGERDEVYAKPKGSMQILYINIYSLI